MKEDLHKPVLLEKVLGYISSFAPLNTQAKAGNTTKVIDATLGLGGYSKALCKRGLNVLAIEFDPEMLKLARKKIERDCPSFRSIQGNFKDIFDIAIKEGFSEVSAVIYDLGISSPQLTDQARGFSFQNPEAVLDIRFDPKVQGIRAMDILNALNKTALQEVFENTYEPYEARKLVKRVLAFRKIKHFEKVADLLEVVRGIFSSKGGIHPATRAFLALRIAVNSELTNLEDSLRAAVKLLKKEGMIIVVSFHSGEDAIVKRTFLNFEDKGLGRVLTKKPVVPDEAELADNPRSRSAKLRVFEKV